MKGPVIVYSNHPNALIGIGSQFIMVAELILGRWNVGRGLCKAYDACHSKGYFVPRPSFGTSFANSSSGSSKTTNCMVVYKCFHFAYVRQDYEDAQVLDNSGAFSELFKVPVHSYFVDGY